MQDESDGHIDRVASIFRSPFLSATAVRGHGFITAIAGVDLRLLIVGPDAPVT